jgi:CBS domain-containing protein
LNSESESLLIGEVKLLAANPPFNGLETDRLLPLLARAQIVFHRTGSQIFHPEIALPERAFWIVRHGSVRRACQQQPGLARTASELLLVGGVFPAEAILDASDSGYCYIAEEDCYLWHIEAAAIDDWLGEMPFLRWLAEELQAQRRAIQKSVLELVSSRQVADQALALPAKSIAAPDPICVPASQALGDVAALMRDKRIGSVLVGTPEAIEGIVTVTDLVRRGIAQQQPYETPIRALMTANPVAVEDSISVFAAAVEMSQGQYRHLLLKSSEGKVVGIVSERDLFRAQQQGISHVFKPIDEADSVEALIELAAKAREFSERIFRQGMEVSQFLRLISSINDRIAKRLLELLLAKRKLPAPFCWLAFGSEGREEQGFVTDQDNGIVFLPPQGESAASLRQAFLELAGEMNEALHACGFERCKGNIMAGNPDWCLSLNEWKARFSSWINASTPTALLNSSIFFDFRPVFGETQLAEDMREHLLEKVKGNSIFLHLLAINALQVAPPLGRISHFATDDGKIDLKTQGTRLFVDIARIYALASGVKAVNTEQRLALVGQRIKRSVSAIQGDIAAFRQVQTLRLQRQLASLGDGGDANRLDPYALNELQQRILRESLRQASSLQDRLKLDYKR